jgi:membrane protein implicated in regulation of membrane protease activity
MPGWAWLAVGVALLIIEIAVQTEFWLAVLGFAALGVGLATSLGLTGPVWAQWAAFGVLSVVLAVSIRRRLHQKFVASAPGLQPELVGERVPIEVDIPTGGTAEVVLRGTTWRARNVGTEPLPKGVTAVVERVDGVTLELRAPDGP